MKKFIPKASKSLTAFVLLLLTGTVYSQTKHEVSVADFSFSPASLEIQVGDTVTWTNIEGSHNVNGTTGTYPDNPLSFGNDVGTGWTYSFVFTEAGTYDYQCDPHASMGMVGEVIVSGGGGSETTADITIEFSSMNPHLNQHLWFSLVNQESDEIIQRIHDTVTTADFTILFPEVETGHSYRIDFYADHNKNGSYNAPPVDHAWRFEIDNLQKDTTLTFVHNTDFTDIDWQHAVTLSLSSMNPHNGQKMVFFVVDNENNTYLDTITIDEVTEENFEVISYSVDTGNSYRIDFYADHNGNGTYDDPPTDHAWRIEIESLKGDTVIPFVHNTTFTDIFDSPTGVRDREFSELVLYPNPAGDFVRISGSDLPAGSLNVQILNLAGQLLRSETIENNGEMTISLNGLSSGAYHMLVRGKNYSARAKLIKGY